MKNKHVRIIGILGLYIFLCIGSPLRAEDNLLTPDQMKENLRYLMDKIIEIHPNPFHSVSKQEYRLIYDDLISKVDHPMTQDEFCFIAMKLIMPLDEAHSGISCGDWMKRDFIPLDGVWLPEGLGIFHTNEENKELVRSRLLALNGIPLDKILDKMSRVVPHENNDWLRFEASGYMFQRFYVEYLTGQTGMDGVTLTLEKDGKTFDKFVKFKTPKLPSPKPNSNSKDEPLPLIIKYRDDISAGYIDILSCLDTPAFMQAINNFMDEVKKRRYKNVIIDVRKNGGGSTDFAFVILKHLPVDEAVGFGGYSKEDKIYMKYAPKLYEAGRKWQRAEEDKKIEPFKGKVYILVGVRTFSSANYLPILLRDNHLATVVGQRTGNTPCAYGAINTLKMPHGDYEFYISHAYFIRPNRICDTNTLIPDKEIPLTLDDVFNGRDPAMEWIEKTLSNETK